MRICLVARAGLELVTFRSQSRRFPSTPHMSCRGTLSPCNLALHDMCRLSISKIVKQKWNYLQKKFVAMPQKIKYIFFISCLLWSSVIEFPPLNIIICILHNRQCKKISWTASRVLMFYVGSSFGVHLNLFVFLYFPPFLCTYLN